jgi:ubiquinone biosynthesis protein
MMGDVDRYARILRVLAKHGFVVLDQEVVHHHDCDEVRAAQLRIALEELGTLFIKLGQFVASQSVALPQPYRVELAKLQDDIPPVAADRIEAVIVRSLGAGVGDLFASFDTKPLGSTSIGQVHAARLADGRDVVVKVKKPGVDDLVATDLSILDGLVRRLPPMSASCAPCRPTASCRSSSER